ncbi:MAG: peptide chain release factor N(5)-glutamine methyltransferase [Sphaerochaetaceae bacterium]|nr:peptide chain release factor N(5)-glutamine methyltransferase [Sphaerochaetaceae bacterium]
MTTGELYRKSVRELESVSDSPSLDAELIFEFVTSLDRTGLFLHEKDELDPDKEEKIKNLIARRKTGEPLSYITGTRGFWKSVFHTPKGVLIPQPDTETLVESAVSKALETENRESFKILDLCSGTGCVGISCALELCGSFKNLSLTLSDISKTAFKAMKENASLILKDKPVSVNCILSDLFDGFEGQKFDMITANPPYIESAVVGTLPAEVQAEPLLALDGGKDGLDLIRRIADLSPLYLRDGGYLLMETGYDQGPRTEALLQHSGFEEVEIIRDLGLRDRVVCGKKLPRQA